MAFAGEIRSFASELPRDWLPCDGRQLKISQNQALFALLGTTYGGDGVETFALPDLRGRATAGTDARFDQPLGSASGLARDNNSLISYTVVRWAIAAFCSFPERS